MPFFWFACYLQVNHSCAVATIHSINENLDVFQRRRLIEEAYDMFIFKSILPPEILGQATCPSKWKIGSIKIVNGRVEFWVPSKNGGCKFNHYFTRHLEDIRNNEVYIRYEDSYDHNHFRREWFKNMKWEFTLLKRLNELDEYLLASGWKTTSAYPRGSTLWIRPVRYGVYCIGFIFNEKEHYPEPFLRLFRRYKRQREKQRMISLAPFCGKSKLDFVKFIQSCITH
jgi:hypothetical protein